MPRSCKPSTLKLSKRFDAETFKDLVLRVGLTIGGVPGNCPIRQCRRSGRCVGPADEEKRPPCWQATLHRKPAIADIALVRLIERAGWSRRQAARRAHRPADKAPRENVKG